MRNQTKPDDGFTDQPPMRCGILTAFALAAVVLLGGCCSHPVAEATLRDGIAVNAGHAKDEALPAEARAVAQDNGDLLWQVLFNLDTDVELPAEVKARHDARSGGD